MDVKEGTKDAILKCVQCENEFTFTNGERRYFQSKGLSVPKRCPDCRARRKQTLVPDNGCASCYYKLSNNLCAYRESEDILEHDCPDWRPK